MNGDKLKYRADPDLAFLEHCDQADLDILVTYLTKTKKGRGRLTETLTKESRFKEFYPEHAKYWDLIAAELQHFGANSLATLVRGKGVPYRKILIAVCSRLKVNFNKQSSVEVIEMNLLMKILIDSLDKVGSEDLKKIIEDLNLKTTNFTKEAVIAALQTAMRAGGFATYKIAMIVANAVAKALLNRGLSLGANAALSRVIGIFVGPIGWILTGVWTLLDVAAPAFRVTIPAVIQVAYMRTKSKEP